MLGYAEGIGEREDDYPKVEIARSLLRSLRVSGFILSTQVLAELHFLLVRKARRHPAAATAIAERWRESAIVVGVTDAVMAEALTLAAEHRLQIFDAVILASVVGEADVLLSEDLQDGFSWRGVTVRNPFTAQTPPRPRA